MNKILTTEVQRLKKMMKNNNISLPDDEEDDESNRDNDYDSDNIYTNNGINFKGFLIIFR